MNISLHEIKQMFKEKFKPLVLKTVKSEALSWLLHRKSQSEKEKIVPLRRLLEIQNYPSMQNEKFCPLCETEVKKVCDTQEHLLECKKLDTAKSIIDSEVKYDDLFCDNLNRQDTITALLESRYTQGRSYLKIWEEWQQSIVYRGQNLKIS